MPRKSGFVLILVMVVVALLTLGILGFTQMMNTEAAAARVINRQSQARAAAESGIEAVRQFMAQDPQTILDDGGTYDNTGQFQAVVVHDDPDPHERTRFTLVAPQYAEGVAATTRYGIENESAKLNINAIFQMSTDHTTQHAILMNLPGMTDDVADSILYWLDPNSANDQSGNYQNAAQDDTYAGMDPPYQATHGPLTSLEELLMVQGVTPSLLYGPDVNRNGQLDPGEDASLDMGTADNSDGSMDAGWAAYLTLYSYENTNNPSTGSPKINVNQSDMNALSQALQGVLDPDQTNFIILYRQYGASTAGGAANATTAGGVTVDLTKAATTNINSLLDLVGVNVQFTTGTGKQAKTTTVTSPFTSDPGSMDNYMGTLYDNLTTTTSTLIPGKININLASQTVLEAIPNITDDVVDSIMSTRPPNPDDPGSAADYQYPTWILSQGIVDLPTMKSLEPYITTGGNVFRVHSIGYFDAGGPAARLEAFLDTTNLPATVLFWREMTHLGRGFTLDTLGTQSTGQ